MCWRWRKSGTRADLPRDAISAEIGGAGGARKGGVLSAPRARFFTDPHLGTSSCLMGGSRSSTVG
jgi:hypothetical protein